MSISPWHAQFCLVHNDARVHMVSTDVAVVTDPRFSPLVVNLWSGDCAAIRDDWFAFGTDAPFWRAVAAVPD